MKYECMQICKFMNRQVYAQTHKLTLRNAHIHMASRAHNKHVPESVYEYTSGHAYSCVLTVYYHEYTICTYTCTHMHSLYPFPTHSTLAQAQPFFFQNYLTSAAP